MSVLKMNNMHIFSFNSKCFSVPPGTCINALNLAKVLTHEVVFQKYTFRPIAKCHGNTFFAFTRTLCHIDVTYM